MSILRRIKGIRLDTYAVEQPEFYVSLIILFAIVATITWLAPDTIPFTLFQFWRFHWDWSMLRNIPWYLLLVIPTLTLIAVTFSKNSINENRKIADSFKDRIRTSILAGIFEEAAYRWLVFYIAIFVFAIYQNLLNWLNGFAYIYAILSMNIVAAVIVLVVANVIGLFALAILSVNETGWLKIPAFIVLAMVALLDLSIVLLISKWWYITVLFPIVNWITLGKFALIFAMSWPIAAAMISSNWSFGAGHVYQGFIGWLHSWVIGMVMFWFMFNFGLLAAMLVHAAFDVVMDTIVSTDAFLELAES